MAPVHLRITDYCELFQAYTRCLGSLLMALQASDRKRRDSRAFMQLIKPHICLTPTVQSNQSVTDKKAVADSRGGDRGDPPPKSPKLHVLYMIYHVLFCALFLFI